MSYIHTLQSALDEFLLEIAHTLAPKTQVYYRTQLTGLFRWCIDEGVSLDTVRKSHLNKYIAKRSKNGISLKTQYDDCLAARKFFRWAAAEGIVPSDPLERYELRKAPKTFIRMPTDTELKDLLKLLSLKASKHNAKSVNGLTRSQARFIHLRNLAIFGMLIDTGMRIGECLALDNPDCDLTRRQLFIRTSKGREPRVVPFGNNLYQPLSEYIKERGKISASADALFIGIYGDRLSSSRLQRIFQALRKEIACEHFTLHGLRHYAITQMAKIDILMAANSAGHKDLKVTQGYIHADADYLRATHEQAAPLGRLMVERKTRRRIL